MHIKYKYAFFVKILVLILPMLSGTNAIAETCDIVPCDNFPTYGTVLYAYGCGGGTLDTAKCYRGKGSTRWFRVYKCFYCPDGYTEIYTNDNFTCDANQKFYLACECICTPECTATGWTDITTGYQQKINNYCSCSSGVAKCNPTTIYRCAAGYYGKSTDGKTGCTKCPTLTRKDGTENPGTSSVGATSITNCYQPQGTEFEDNVGVYKFTGACFNTGE